MPGFIPTAMIESFRKRRNYYDKNGKPKVDPMANKLFEIETLANKLNDLE